MTPRSLFSTILLKLSLAGASLMFALPFLNPRHYAPIPTFYAEWAAAILLLIAGMTLLRREIWNLPLIPKIVMLPVGLVVIALLQWVLGQGGQKEALIFFLLYMLGAVFAMVVGQNLRQELGFHRLMLALASCLLVGALAGALIAVLSLFEPHWLPSLVEDQRGYSQAMGNLAQRNHLANYLWAGVTAACFLHLSRRLPKLWLIAALAPLLLVAAMTSSRSSIIYLIGFNLLSLLWWYRSRSVRARRLMVVALMLIPGFLLAQSLSPERFTASTSIVKSEVSEFFERRDQPITKTSIKILGSQIALAMFAEKPLLGNGIGSYFWRSFVLAEQFTTPIGVHGHAEHAHNLLTHLLAELGVGSLLVLIITLAIWWRGIAVQRRSAAHVWLLSVLMIEAWHSMVEYPLWYAYFLLPTALLLGAADRGAIILRMSPFLRSAMAMLLLVGAFVLNNLRGDYLRLEYALHPGLESGQRKDIARTFAEINPSLLKLYDNSLFAPYVGLLYAMALAPTRNLLEENLEITERAAHFYPASHLVYKYALLLALAGRGDEALRQQRWAIRGYPQRLPSFVRELRTLLSADPTLPFDILLRDAEAEAMRRAQEAVTSNN